MKQSKQFKEVYSQINSDSKLGDLRKIAKTIKKDHELALELWTMNELFPRLLSILIMDKKELTQETINSFCNDIVIHGNEEQNQLIDWLMANQLSKDKKCINLIESWEDSKFVLQRRIFWYYQARLRWMGKTNQSNTEQLLKSIEKNILKEKPAVQWAMNFTAGQIGKWQSHYRERCIKIGEDTGLYKDEIVSKGCTPSYLPYFIEIEVQKLNK